LNVEIKKRPEIEKIEAEGVYVWKEMEFTPANVLLRFRQKIVHYSYEAFQKNIELLNSNLFMS
jgi:hypothetical protein